MLGSITRKARDLVEQQQKTDGDTSKCNKDEGETTSADVEMHLAEEEKKSEPTASMFHCLDSLCSFPFSSRECHTAAHGCEVPEFVDCSGNNCVICVDFFI